VWILTEKKGSVIQISLREGECNLLFIYFSINRHHLVKKILKNIS